MITEHPFPPFLEELTASAEEIEIHPTTRYFFMEHGFVWLVKNNEADIYAWEETEQLFIPLFLQSVTEGDLIFGTPAGKDQFFFLIANTTLTLIKIPLAKIQSLIVADREARQWFIEKIEYWVGQLLSLPALNYQNHSEEIAISPTVQLEAGKRVSIKQNLTPEQKKRLLWIGCQQGEIHIGGDPVQTLMGDEKTLLPITPFFVIEAIQSSTISIATTDSVIEDPRIYQGIEKLHHHLFVYYEAQKNLEREMQLQKHERKSVFAKKDLAGSLSKLGSLLEKKIYEKPIEGDFLYFAMEKIGKKLGIAISETRQVQLDPEQRIKEICEHARLFYREIILVKQWWKKVTVPLLVFLGESRIPIALINNPSGYEFTHPETGQVFLVDQKIAAQIYPRAFSFFSPILDEKVSFLGLLKFAFLDFKREMLIIVLIAVGTAILNLYLPFAMKQLFDLLTVSANITVLKQLTLGLILVAFSMWAFNTTKNFTEGRFSSLSQIKIQMGMWGRILSLPVSLFRKYTAGEFMNRFLSVNGIHALVTSSALASLTAFCYMFFYFLEMLLFNAYLTFMMMLPFACIVIIYTVCILKQIKFINQITEMSGKLQGFVVQMITGLAKLRVAGAENRFFGIWSKRFFERKKIDLSFQRYQAFANLMTMLFPMFATVIIYAVGLKLFVKQLNSNQEIISMGVFVGFTTAFGLFTNNALSLLQLLFSLSRIQALWKNAKEILSVAPEATSDKERVTELQGRVMVDGVSFRYGGEEEEWVLNDISFFANPGEMIAIVGPSGSGKSTVVRLLLGFEKPSQGEVLYDDKNLEDLDARSVRSKIGTVLQNGALSAGSIYENIVGSGKYTVEQLKQAIYRSGFEQDLKALPMGIHTVVPMDGETFSGGQKQRLLLAKALIGSPKILILDEATSALDNLMQDFVSSQLDQLNLTRIVIAHRMSTIKNADRIYVLEKGVITQTGTYQELASQKGFFSSMLSRQQL